MTTIKNFEDLQSWQKARELAGYVYTLTRKQKFSHDFGLCSQIQKAAGSVMHNIAEGFEAGYDLNLFGFQRWHDVQPVKFNLSFTSRLTPTSSRRKNLGKPMIWQLKPKNLSMA
jgi:hypothetical protein